MRKNLLLTATALMAGMMLIGCEANQPMPAMSTSAALAELAGPEKSRAIQQALTDKDIAMLLDAKVQAKLPTHVAVAKLQCPPIDSGHYYRNGSGQLVTVPAGELDAIGKAIVDAVDIKGVRVVSELSEVDPRGLLHGLRVSSARMNCELLLVYLQMDAAVDNYNDAAALYWTVIGLWTVPGNTYDRRTIMQAVLFDCRTGMILGTCTAQGDATTSYAAAYKEIAYDKLSGQTPQLAFDSLQKKVGQMVGQVVVEARKPATAAVMGR